uniref:Uncharacterized protein n=1 Tax=Ananas comosus var. bracteatus TaxID=296719 RepID=A0A6V7NNW8_ANACO|nr:unnamed protein product [Ananas comosus var. bracteatus]
MRPGKRPSSKSILNQTMGLDNNPIPSGDIEGSGRENSAYAKCRDKPFLAYKDIEFLSATTTATGRFGMSSQMPAATIDSSSSSSPGEDDTIIGIIILRVFPSPPLVQPNVGTSASGSGHSSAAGLSCREALLNDKHRRPFMTMNDRVWWIECQVALQDVLYKQNFPDF